MKAFSKNGQPTILPKNKNVGSLGNHQLSDLDIKQTNKLYKCSGPGKFLPNLIFFYKKILSAKSSENNVFYLNLMLVAPEKVDI